MQLKWPMLWDLFSLFPAYAGVILLGGSGSLKVGAFPRIRGGDPDASAKDSKRGSFSPHTRG